MLNPPRGHGSSVTGLGWAQAVFQCPYIYQLSTYVTPSQPLLCLSPGARLG